MVPTGKLKEVLGTILPLLTHTVNSSLDQGKYYEDWKEELAKPLAKQIY